ncbi:COG0863 DNA modification methylase [uncultured Caudovirales phage]|uniref:COG0863 DNA modification methylase n=1 Tax=uncultured Caudovirales phage TaxID=2100421 RepID=A0A6J5S1K9_9CAUD|nr:COG0863 DNA modification methylase [uncultured Caudovirales phage]
MRIGLGTFLEGDCFERMAAIEDGSVDMVLCDLPYGTTQNKWDSVLPLERLWAEYWRVCKPDAAVVLTAAQPFTSQLVLSQLQRFKQELVWCKNVASDFLNANRRHMAKHESVLIFARGRPPYNPQLSPGKAYTAKRYGNDDTGDNYGQIAQRTDTVNDGHRKPTSVLHFDRQVGAHPTQKPVALFEYLIRTYTNQGGCVLDNTAGSGTTAEAAENAARRWVCIERDPDYYAKAVDRLLKHTHWDIA